jgi:ribosome-binding protein aMBF1 (putative translation factor)
MPVSSIAYHVHYLDDLGVIRLVARTQVRGAVQHHYTLVDHDAAAVALARREGRKGLGELGAVLRRTREQQGVTIPDLAGRIGIDVNRLERIEAGDVDSQLELLFALATALDTTLEQILAEVA